MQRVLYMPLLKKWFDMIAAGIKLEEYRELTKYWKSRLMNAGQMAAGSFKRFDIVRFTNGYGKKCPSIDVEWLGTKIGEGRKEWGAISGKQYFVILLGKILSKKLTGTC
jgi:hypothetical protein